MEISEWKQHIEAERKEKDAFFKTPRNIGKKKR